MKQQELHNSNHNNLIGQKFSQCSIGAQQNGASGLFAQFKRVCYFRMDPKTEIQLSEVDGSLCTHLILAFFRIDNKGNLVYGNKETDIYYLKEVNQFKKKWPDVKIMISVYNEMEYNGFPLAATDMEIRKNFARSSMEFLKQHNLDGIDLDWEFPNFPHTFRSREYEKVGLTKIVQALRSAIVENFFDRQVAEYNSTLKQQTKSLHQAAIHSTNQQQLQQGSQVEPYLLSIAIAAQEPILKSSYQLRQLANLCDWFNVMSYDYYLFKSYIPFTGPNSPLNAIVIPQVPILSKLSLSWTLSRLLTSADDSIPANKIVMGIPTYARAYRLLFRQTGPPVPFTLSVGPKGGKLEDYLSYREVCDIMKKTDTIVEFDMRARVPYCLADDGYTWISYENPQSVREKVYFILTNQLAGYMTWNLNSDDFIGQQPNDCQAASNGKSSSFKEKQLKMEPSSAFETFPLHRAMLHELRKFLDGLNCTNNDSYSKLPIMNHNGNNGQARESS